MKKILVIVSVFISFYTHSQNIQALDALDGFSDVHFGDSISKYPGMEIIETSKDSLFLYCKRASDSKIYPNANLEIVYSFFKGELAYVYLGTRDSSTSRMVLQSLQKQFGNGRKEDPYVEKYMWYGSKVILQYAEDVNKFTAKIFFNSIKMQLKIEARH